MNAADESLQHARQSLDLYESQVESYTAQLEKGKKDHQAAMRCFRLEGLLAHGLSLFDYINRLDEAWRKWVFRKKVKYDPDMDRLVGELYRWWYKSCPRILECLVEMEKRFEVEGAEEFRSACREVEGILTPDEKFFTGERLAKLRDRAVEAHRQGRTEEMGSLND